MIKQNKEYPYLITVQYFLISRGVSYIFIEDIIQEIYLRYWQSIYRSKNTLVINNLRAYLIQIAKSVISSPKIQTRPLHNFGIDPDTISEREMYKTHSALTKAINYEEISNVIDTLTIRQRYVFILRMIYDMPTKELAAYLDISVRSVNRLLKCSMDKLSKLNLR